jgi:hypothetical protein
MWRCLQQAASPISNFLGELSKHRQDTCHCCKHAKIAELKNKKGRFLPRMMLTKPFIGQLKQCLDHEIFYWNGLTAQRLPVAGLAVKLSHAYASL